MNEKYEKILHHKAFKSKKHRPMPILERAFQFAPFAALVGYEDKIKEMKSEIVSFLNGNTKILTDRLKEKMYSYSEKMDYEKAMEYKELLDYINITTEKQKVDLDSKVNTDIVGYYTKDNYISIQILFVRGGKLLDRNRVIFPMVTTEEEELSNYLLDFYSKNVSIPKEVLTPDMWIMKLLLRYLILSLLLLLREKRKEY